MFCCTISHIIQLTRLHKNIHFLPTKNCFNKCDFLFYRPEKLLKPTDIPKHVIDEKKSDRKTEKETKATEAEVKDENSQKPVEVVTNKNDPQVPVQVPKSPSATRKKGKGKQTVMVQKKSKSSLLLHFIPHYSTYFSFLF